MKLNEEWEKEWQNIPVPKEKIFKLIEETVQPSPTKSKKFQKNRNRVAIASGVVLLAAGILLFINQRDGISPAKMESAEGPSTEVVQNEAKVSENASDQAGVTSENTLSSDKQVMKTFQLSKETNKFDESLKQVKDKIAKNNGTLENSSIENQQQNSRNQRTANYVIRIPEANQEGFFTDLSKVGVTISEQETATDRTLEYTDLQSRLTALKTEEETLLKLLADAKSIEDLLKVEERLAQVRGEKDSLEQQNLYLKNAVDQSTVYLSLQEVTQYSQVDQNISTWENVRNSLTRQWQFWKDFGHNGLIWFLSHLQYFVLLGGISWFGWSRYEKHKKLK